MKSEGDKSYSVKDQISKLIASAPVINTTYIGNARNTRFPDGTDASVSENKTLRQETWLLDYVNPKLINYKHRIIYNENHTREFLILETISEIVTKYKSEWPMDRIKKLRQFRDGFRVAAFPNMNKDEQNLLKRLARTLPDVWHEPVNTPKLQKEIDFIWQTFGFKTPPGGKPTLHDEQILIELGINIEK